MFFVALNIEPAFHINDCESFFICALAPRQFILFLNESKIHTSNVSTLVFVTYPTVPWSNMQLQYNQCNGKLTGFLNKYDFNAS